MLVGKESTWEEDHSNLGAGFGQLEDFCTSWVKNFDVNPRSGCSLFVRRLKDVDENGDFCQNRFSHFRICNGANFCAQEISTNQLFIRTVCLFLFLSQYINLSLCLFVFLYLCITRLLPRSWQWLEGTTQMVSAAGRGRSTSQSRRAQMIQKQKQYFPRLQKYNLTNEQVWLELPSLPEGRAAHACFATKVSTILTWIHLSLEI